MLTLTLDVISQVDFHLELWLNAIFRFSAVANSFCKSDNDLHAKRKSIHLETAFSISCFISRILDLSIKTSNDEFVCRMNWNSRQASRRLLFTEQLSFECHRLYQNWEDEFYRFSSNHTTILHIKWMISHE